MWGYYFNRLCHLLHNWIWMNMIFKSNGSQMFYKIIVVKNFTKFIWKYLRPVNLSKRDSALVFPTDFCEILKIKTPFLQINTGRLLLDFFINFTVFLSPGEIIETRLFTFLNMFYKSDLWNVMNVMNFAIEKLYFAKQKKVLSNIY